MNATNIEAMLDWMRGTDLVELHFKKNGDTVTLTLREAHGPLHLPPSRLLPVPSPAVGVFRRAAPGRAAQADKGAAVKKDAELGVVECGTTKAKVCAPADGRVVRTLVEDGQGVEYGQPLFLIEPA